MVGNKNKPNAFYYSGRIFTWCFIILAFSHVSGQPLLIVGEGDAEFKAAFSYDFLKSPLQKRFDRSVGEVTVNVPVNISQPLHSTIENYAGDFLSIPQFTARAQQAFNTSLEISSPMFGGAAFFSIRENASLQATGSIGNANVWVDTVKKRDEGRVSLRGSINLPLTFEAFWRTMTFGFTMEATDNIKIGFQIHKHEIGASTSGNLSTSLAGRIEQKVTNNIIVIDANYPEGYIYGYASGFYHGEGWSPEIGIQFGPLSLVSRMGFEIEAKGHLYSDYAIPFFIDEKTFIPKYTEPDSFLAPENMRRMLNSEITSNSYRIEDNLILSTPQSHSIALEVIRDKFLISYTKIFGKIESRTIAGAAQYDTTLFSTDDFLNASLSLDHMLIFSLDFEWFNTNIGASTINVSYRKNKDILSDILGDYLPAGMDPLMPIWNFGFRMGLKGAATLNFFVLPFPAVRTGYQYVF